MGTTGLIFGAIVAAWLAYLVPMYLRKHQAAANQADPASRFSHSIRIVQVGGAMALDDDGKPVDRARVSTPLTRRAAAEEIRRLEQRAAGRRRTVIVVLALAALSVIGLCLIGLCPWWAVVIPGGLLVSFLAIARVSVNVMHKDFDRRLERIHHDCEEETVIVAEAALSGEQGRKKCKTQKSGRVESVELGAPVGRPGTLWDPLPITRPTYVSAPPAGGRTVRTIDLTAPLPVGQDNHPVVADAPEPQDEGLEAVSERTLRRAVGE